MVLRLVWLGRLVDGYRQSGIPWIVSNGSELSAMMNFGDDVGLFYFVPLISKFFLVSMDRALEFFLFGIAGIACLIGIVGFFFLYRSFLPRLISVVGLLVISAIIIKSCRLDGDCIYAPPAVGVMAIVPWALYYLTRRKASVGLYSFMVFAGVVVGLCNFVRNCSGLPVLIFVLALLVLRSDWTWKRRFILASALVVGILLVIGFIKLLVFRHAEFCLANKITPLKEFNHPLWHTVYWGLGFLQKPFNTTGIYHDDQCVIDLVRDLNPSAEYLSAEYHSTVRDALLRLIIRKPLLFFRTVFAKLGCCLLYFLMFCNIGIVASLWRRKSLSVDIAFIVAMLVSIIPGLVAIPSTSYLMGFVALSILYAIVSVANALGSNVFGLFGDEERNEK